MNNQILSRLFSLCFFVVTFTLPFTGRAATVDLYVTDLTAGTIFKFAPDGSKSIFASGLDTPAGLAFDRTGNLYVAERLSGTILKFAPDGTKSTFASGLSSPTALSFDGLGNLFVTESMGDIGSIAKFTPAGAKSLFTSGGNFLELAFDISGNLFAAVGGPTALPGAIVKFTPDGTSSDFALAAGPGMAFGSSAVLFADDHSGSGGIAKFAPDGGRTSFTAAVDNPAFLAVDAAGNLFVTDSINGERVEICS